jgi:ribonuclease VapC
VSRAVLDSSAVLASFYGETGADIIDEILRESVISAVNAGEIISKLVERGMPADMARSSLIDIGIEIVPFDLDQAEVTGDLRGKTRMQGLSFGDRACLALAKRLNGRAGYGGSRVGGCRRSRCRDFSVPGLTLTRRRCHTHHLSAVEPGKTSLQNIERIVQFVAADGQRR